MAITVTGPTTKDTSTVALGLAKILVGKSADNIAEKEQVLDETEDSLGALNSTEFTSEVEYWRLTSGFPAMEDMSIPLSEVARLDCEFKEITPKNLAYARGIDATSGYGDAHSGEITLGNLSSPAFVRMEAIYTYPNATNHLYIIFPRANVTSSVNLAFAAEDNANVPVSIEAKRCDSGVSGGDAAWDNSPLGRIYFD
ncbi:MAG: hypothetical protein ACOC80_11005 [Petrotogales bacterium]